MKRILLLTLLLATISTPMHALTPSSSHSGNAGLDIHWEDESGRKMDVTKKPDSTPLLSAMSVEVNSQEYSHFNIYMGDKYFRISDQAKPIATVPVANHRFCYEAKLDRMVVVGVRGVNASGVESGRMATAFLVPGESVSLSFFGGNLPFLDAPSATYEKKINEEVGIARRTLSWKMPENVHISGKALKNFRQEKETFMNVAVKECYLGRDETVVWLYHPKMQSFVELLDSEAYIEDEHGNRYQALRALGQSQFGIFHDPQSVIFGASFAFEPLPLDCKSFTIHTILCGDIKIWRAKGQ